MFECEYNCPDFEWSIVDQVPNGPVLNGRPFKIGPSKCLVFKWSYFGSPLYSNSGQCRVQFLDRFGSVFKRSILVECMVQ